MSKHSLDGAYSLNAPEDSVEYYRDWADDYDQQFAAAHGYTVPAQIAAIFRAEGGMGPVLDIGAGTGLVAQALGEGDPLEVDGIDISAEMLRVAGEKGLYQNRIVADLTKPLEIADAAYSGFLSAGTFTHGHVGPGCLNELLRIASSNALFVLAVNEQVFDQAGFGSAFARAVADGSISPVRFRKIPYYEEADHEHADDHGLVAVFRRL